MMIWNDRERVSAGIAEGCCINEREANGGDCDYGTGVGQRSFRADRTEIHTPVLPGAGFFWTVSA